MRRGLLAPTLVAALVTTALPALAATATAAPGPVSSSGTAPVPAPPGVGTLVASQPSVSADGRWTAFVGRVDGVSRLHRHDAASGTTTVVDTGAGEVSEPSISDDGRWIAFTRRFPGQPSQVHLTDVLHSVTRLVSGTNEGEPGNGDSSQPRVNRDGSRVVLTTLATDVIDRPSRQAGSGPGADVVLAQRVEAGFLVHLLSPEVPGLDFTSPSPDEEADRTVFASSTGRVWVAEHAGGRTTAREVAVGTAPALSADGSSVAMLRGQRMHDRAPERSATWLRTLATGTEVQVDVDADGWPLAGDASAPAVGADGSTVLLTHTRPDGSPALVLRDADVGTTRVVADRFDAGAGAALSDDGRWATYVVDGTLVRTDLHPAPRAGAPRAIWSALVQRAAARAKGRGYVLRADPARWEPVRAGRVERQWLRNGRPIRGATGLTYEITAADIGADVAVRERMHVPGAPVGSDTSRAYRVRPDRSVLTLPGKVVRARPGAVRLRVRVTTAPGSETYVPGSVVPQGRVRARVDGHSVTRRVGADGWATVVLRKQRPGRKVVRVRHLGTPYVVPAAPRSLRLVVRRGR